MNQALNPIASTLRNPLLVGGLTGATLGAGYNVVQGDRRHGVLDRLKRGAYQGGITGIGIGGAVKFGPSMFSRKAITQ
jgi:hypothetical protein